MCVQSSLAVEQEGLSLLHDRLKPFFPCSQGGVFVLGWDVQPGHRAVRNFPGPLRPRVEGGAEIRLEKNKYTFVRTCPSTANMCIFGPLPPAQGLTIGQG